MAAYENLPFRGGPLLLPNGIVVSEDLWRCQLEMESSLDKNFSLEEWLKRKVETDGSAKQKRDLADLVSRFDDWERNSVDDALGLPAEISVMEHQVEEIMVYRGLPTDIVVPEDEDEDDSEEAIAM